MYGQHSKTLPEKCSLFITNNLKLYHIKRSLKMLLDIRLPVVSNAESAGLFLLCYGIGSVCCCFFASGCLKIIQQSFMLLIDAISHLMHSEGIDLMTPST